MKYAWILEQSKVHNVVMLCSILSVSRSAYYAWTKAALSQRVQDDAALKTIITTTFTEHRAIYGTRRMKAALATQGYPASRRRIGRIMKEAQLYCKTKRRFKATTDSKHDLPIAPNRLARQFDVKRPNQVYVGDITYIPTAEGWLYLAVVIDLYSRQVVGWSMADHMRTELVNDALLMAILST